MNGWPALTLRVEMPATLRLTKYGTCAFTSPPCRSWITCQPPRPSGICTLLVSVPSEAAVPVPSGTETKLQQVPVQLTRLPTTVDQTRVTGWLGASPFAETSTFDRIGPVLEFTVADAWPAVRPRVARVVFASRVGATEAGQSICCFGSPASFVTVNVNVFPVAHGIGACGMLRYS